MNWPILLLLSGLCSAALAAEKPNIVIPLADDLQPDGLASLGNPIVKTPNVDKLVSSGFTFRRAYVQGAMTTGVCARRGRGRCSSTSPAMNRTIRSMRRNNSTRTNRS